MFKILMTVFFLFLGVLSSIDILAQDHHTSLDCIQKFAGKSGKIRMAGGTALVPFMQDVADGLKKGNPELKIFITGGGSGLGVQQLGAGLIDIANTGRVLSQEEKRRLNLVSYPVAMDAIVFIVHPSNPLRNLGRQEAEDIFSGQMKSWSHGKKAPIHLYVRDEASGTQEIFVEKIMQGKKLDKLVHFTNSQGAMKLAVSQDEGAIGFLSFGYLDPSVKSLSFEGVEARLSSIQGQTYPLVRLLYVHTQQKPAPLILDFVSHLFSPNSAAAITRSGLIPVENKSL